MSGHAIGTDAWAMPTEEAYLAASRTTKRVTDRAWARKQPATRHEHKMHTGARGKKHARARHTHVAPLSARTHECIRAGHFFNFGPFFVTSSHDLQLLVLGTADRCCAVQIE